MHNEMGEILLDSQKRVVKRVNKIASPYVASEGMKFSWVIVQGAHHQRVCRGRNFERPAELLKSRRESGEKTLILRFSVFWALTKLGVAFCT